MPAAPAEMVWLDSNIVLLVKISNFGVVVTVVSIVIVVVVVTAVGLCVFVVTTVVGLDVGVVGIVVFSDVIGVVESIGRGKMGKDLSQDFGNVDAIVERTKGFLVVVVAPFLVVVTVAFLVVVVMGFLVVIVFLVVVIIKAAFFAVVVTDFLVVVIFLVGAAGGFRVATALATFFIFTIRLDF